jgi:predicted HD superfamily hydrolase involved in NAD metabolism
MHPILIALHDQLELTGDTGADVMALLRAHGLPKTAEHSRRVAHEAGRIAARAGADSVLATQAGWLHDVSAVFPAPERAQIAAGLGLEVLPEEAAFPMIAHQRLSKVLARELFGIRDQEVLDAIGCHTTLRGQATRMDKVLFVADKLEWDQAGVAPYRDDLLAALEHSVDEAAAFFVGYLWARRDTLKVIHPWLREAYAELGNTE